MIPQEQPFASQAAMIFLAVTLSFISVLGNGSFMAIFPRFNVFRSFPNILFINLALIDFLNALVNVPLFVMYFVLQTSWLTGKTWAIISSSLNLELSLLNLVSMTVLMLDRFLAVYLDLKYFTWKTTKKAKIAVFLMWLVCTILVVIFSVPLLDMDLGGKPLIVCRKKISGKKAGSNITHGLIHDYFYSAWKFNGLFHSSEEKTGKERFLLKKEKNYRMSIYCLLVKNKLRAIFDHFSFHLLLFIPH